MKSKANNDNKRGEDREQIDCLLERIEQIEEQLKDERGILLEVILNLSAAVRNGAGGDTGASQISMARGLAYGDAAPRTKALAREEVAEIVVTVLNGLTKKEVTQDSSFNEDDLDWDNTKKRSAFTPIRVGMEDRGSGLVGIGPKDFEPLETVLEMIDLCFDSQS